MLPSVGAMAVVTWHDIVAYGDEVDCLLGVPCQNSRNVSELVFSVLLRLLCGTR